MTSAAEALCALCGLVVDDANGEERADHRARDAAAVGGITLISLSASRSRGGCDGGCLAGAVIGSLLAGGLIVGLVIYMQRKKGAPKDVKVNKDFSDVQAVEVNVQGNKV